MYVSSEYQGHDAIPLEFHERTRHGGDDEEWDLSGAMGDSGYPSRSRADAGGLSGGGRPNPILMPMIRSSLEKVVSLQSSRDTAGRVISKAAEWARPATQRIAACARSLSLEVPTDRAPHMIGIRIRDDDDRVIDKLSAVKSIIAHLKSSGVHCELRVGAIRVGYGIWNTFDDIERFCSALEEAVDRALGRGRRKVARARLAGTNVPALTPSAVPEKVNDRTKAAISTTTPKEAKQLSPTTTTTVKPTRSLWYDILNF